MSALPERQVMLKTKSIERLRKDLFLYQEELDQINHTLATAEPDSESLLIAKKQYIETTRTIASVEASIRDMVTKLLRALEDFREFSAHDEQVLNENEIYQHALVVYASLPKAPL